MISIDWLSQKINVGDHGQIDPTVTFSKVSDFVTHERKEKIERVLEKRSTQFVPVLESIYDRGNISAVMRSAEAFGFFKFHIIETSEKFKESARVTQGADKWLDIHKWNNTKECILNLKKEGYRVCTTHLSSDAKPFHEMDFSKPIALILGNEKDGVSKEALELSDENVLLPMAGFTQSFNISVAGALSCYTAFQKVEKYIDGSEKELLKAYYYLKSLHWTEEQLANFF